MNALKSSAAAITVAGSAGLAGTHLLARLAAGSVPVRALYRSRRPLESPHVIPLRTDLGDPVAARKAVAGSHTVICLAAETGGSGWSADRWWSHAQDNLRLWTSLAEACRAEGVRRVFFALSATSYQPSERPLTEQDMNWGAPLEGSLSTFGWANRYFEKLCAEWSRREEVLITLARVSNLYGPHDHFEPERAHVIPALIRRACLREDPFTVLGDGKPVRDVLYAGDFADAVLRWLDRPSPAGLATVNVGSGIGVSIDTIARSVLEAAGHNPARISYNGPASARPDTRVLDVALARRLWDWAPQTTLSEGLRKTVEWWRDRSACATSGVFHENSQS